MSFLLRLLSVTQVTAVFAHHLAPVVVQFAIRAATEYNKVNMLNLSHHLLLKGMIEFVPDAITVCKLQAEEASKRANGDIAR